MSDDDTTPDNVITVAFGSDAAPRYPLERAPWRSDTCAHARSRVDARARTVTCVACGVAVDPIDVLDKIANDPEWLKRARADRRRLQAEIEELRGEVMKLRAARRKARTA